ncbi:hypothetical protein QQX98_003780 [Neonectria punicea]|uniref:Secreted protein CSS2 C-terminal domain-containing protein n=1 Tax=Neonectria punicea TaxID=979145 RepID=A0ABR1HCV6_9HYPO
MSSIVTSIFHTSRQKECGVFYARAGDEGEVTYKYQANRHCDTAAEQGSIARAVLHQIKDKGCKITRTECLDLSQGHVWDGFLLIGPTDGFEHDMYCGPVFAFDLLWDNSANKDESEKKYID